MLIFSLLLILTITHATPVRDDADAQMHSLFPESMEMCEAQPLEVCDLLEKEHPPEKDALQRREEAGVEQSITVQPSNGEEPNREPSSSGFKSERSASKSLCVASTSLLDMRPEVLTEIVTKLDSLRDLKSLSFLTKENQLGEFINLSLEKRTITASLCFDQAWLQAYFKGNMKIRHLKVENEYKTEEMGQDSYWPKALPKTIKSLECSIHLTPNVNAQPFFKTLNDLPQLEKLELSLSWPFTSDKVNLGSLKDLRVLKSLEMDCVGLDDSVSESFTSFFCNCLDLESLKLLSIDELGDTVFESFISILSNLKNLKHLFLYQEFSLGNRARSLSRGLQYLTNIESLQLPKRFGQKTHEEPRIQNVLGALVNLKKLTLWSLDEYDLTMTEELGKSLENLKFLRSLIIIQNDISEANLICLLRSIQSLSGLTHLRLYDDKFSPTAMKSIDNTLRKLSVLENFSLGCRPFSLFFPDGHPGLSGYPACLGAVTSLTKLSLSVLRNKDHFQAFTYGLSSLRQLKTLAVRESNLDASEASLLLKGVEKATGLQVLNLTWNKIGEGDVHSFFEELRHFKQLRELSLRKNHWSGKGSLRLGQILQDLPSLEVLDISCNSISDGDLLILIPYFEKMNVKVKGQNCARSSVMKARIENLKTIAFELKY
jgi:hypothetical protein